MLVSLFIFYVFWEKIFIQNFSKFVGQFLAPSFSISDQMPLKKLEVFVEEPLDLLVKYRKCKFTHF